PHEVIRFDNTVPQRYQGKHFRPTSLSYDLRHDKIHITAYEIDSYTENAGPEPFPPPWQCCGDTPPPDYGNFSEYGMKLFNPDYGTNVGTQIAGSDNIVQAYTVTEIIDLPNINVCDINLSNVAVLETALLSRDVAPG